MKFYSALAFFLLCTMLVLSNPIRSTEETENKLIEKRAKIPQSLIDYVKGHNGVADLGNELGKAVKDLQKEKDERNCIEKREAYYLDCLKKTNYYFLPYCYMFLDIKC
ncbi:hypothetical protein BCR32DRAFT_279928 [Anaeromyces robustus]|uniref:Uncharacterized protein n=1 Tax=Anaeromyces robustus TaxID=1754192 RepID=A0A1Y1X703_9FUNG|nr:hypothetical protein BCR32DRAFT_279928 [Anaeromyces robustus]|eukprot:ORX81166.1 hypothetical protein BCR32DRAFT_279928 [Anaeromyces robustus]